MSRTRLPTKAKDKKPAPSTGSTTSSATSTHAPSETPASSSRATPATPYVQLPQLKAQVSQPGDPMEREADDVAARVTSGSPSASPVSLSSRGGQAQRQVEDEPISRMAGEEEIQREAIDDEPIQRRAAGGAGGGMGAGPRMTPRTQSTISNPGAGEPLATSARHQIEPHVGADLGGVRVHTGADAAHAATSLHARAFTVGNDIFLNRQESTSDLGLMAHESAHTVQQGGPSAAYRSFTQDQEVQRLPDLITDELASYARHVPGYTLFTVIIGFNPLTGRGVDRTATNLVEGLMGIVPFGTYIFDQIAGLGILQETFAYISKQLSTFDLSLERLERTISDAWDEMDFLRLDPFDYNLGVLRRHAGKLLDDVKAFASTLVAKVIELIKDAVLGVAEDLLAENKAWDLLKKVLKYDPLRGEAVESTTEEIIEDFLMLIGKETELQQMKERGTLTKTAEWIDTQFATFAGLVSELGALFTAAWDAIQPENLSTLGQSIDALIRRAGSFLQRVWDFAATVAREVLALIKDALLSWLSGFAHNIPGFHLLTVILGKNPFTNEVVPRNAVNLIRGFITLIPGGNAIYDNLAETGVIGEAGSRIEGALAELGISWDLITGVFLGIWEGLSIDDLVDPIGAFQRIAEQFGEPIARIFAFIKTVIIEVFKLILAMMNFPSELLASIIANVVAAITNIMRDPIGFLINMLAALKLGFTNFFTNFLTHLVDGLVEWLFGGLRQAGIEPPADLSFGSILDTVLQVLGITIERIWEKLAERFGEETIDKIRGAVDRLVGIWNFVSDVIERGVVAIWEYIEGQLSNLWELVLSAATKWISETIISQVVTKLLSLLDPTGIMAVVNGFIAFFNAVQSAIEYIREILEIIDSYVATFAAVAAGDIEPGAARMEGGLAAVIPVALGFLANQIGLGNIGEKIAEIVEGVREVVDKAIDWLLDQLEAAIESIKAMFGMGGDDPASEEADATEAAGVDPADHPAFALHALTRLASAERPEAGTPFEQLQAAAATLAPTLSGQLEDGIGLTFTFPGGEQDAADGEVATTVTIAPNDTTITRPTSIPAGAPPALGTAGPYTAMNSLQSLDENKGLQAEHVIPRYAYGEMMKALGGGGAPNSSKFYRQARTILIYQDAARIKNGFDPSPSDVTKAIADAQPPAATPDTDRSVLKGNFDTQVRKWESDLANDTSAAVEAENTGAAGQARGTSGDDGVPLAAAIAAAALGQANQIIGWLAEERDHFVKATNDTGSMEYKILTQLRSGVLRSGMTSPQRLTGGNGHDGWVQVEIPMGPRGGQRHTGNLQLSVHHFGGSDFTVWELRLGTSSTSPVRGTGTVGTVGDGVNLIGRRIEALRDELRASGGSVMPTLTAIRTAKTAADFQVFRGIGPALAEEAVRARNKVGPDGRKVGRFKNRADVVERISGLGPTFWNPF